MEKSFSPADRRTEMCPKGCQEMFASQVSLSPPNLLGLWTFMSPRSRRRRDESRPRSSHPSCRVASLPPGVEGFVLGQGAEREVLKKF